MPAWLDAVLATDLVAAVLLLEAAWLAWRRWRHGRGPRLRELLAMLGAGFALVMALRSALGGPGVGMLAWLAVAGLLHAWDLTQRIGGQRPGA